MVTKLFYDRKDIWKERNEIPMMVKNINIGEDIPKICVPIVGVTEETILRSARDIFSSKADIVEWRVDWYEDALCVDKVIELTNKVRSVLEEKPILFTFRTKAEGGEKEISETIYLEMISKVMESGNVDLVDVECFSMANATDEILKKAREYKVKVVGSNHDFEKTPNKDEIIRRLTYMKEQGIDIAKIAVMPQKEEDVATILEATKEMHMRYPKYPLVTMSMGEMGVVSRVEGEKYGSVMTFGCLEQASAPGQMNVDELKEILMEKHRLCSK